MLQPLTFAEFYPRYLREHSRSLRVLYFVGTTLVTGLPLSAVFSGRLGRLGAGTGAADGLAWLGRFFVERNRPATFQHSWFSLRGDFRLYLDLWCGRERFAG